MNMHNSIVGVLVYTLVCVYFPSKHNNFLANLLYILYYGIQINYCLFILQYTNHQLHVSASIAPLRSLCMSILRFPLNLKMAYRGRNM
jgi:hypothetical protein